MQMAIAPMKVQGVRPMAVRPTGARRGAMALVRSAPEKKVIDDAVKEAEEACKGGDSGECAAAWDTVEELNAAASHAKDAASKQDPLEKYCEDAPDADECRVYED